VTQATAPEAAQEYRRLVRDRVLDETTFIDLTLSEPPPGSALPWRKVVVRPVVVRNRRRLQFSSFDEKRDITKNYDGAEAVTRLDEVLSMPFRSIVARSRDSDLRVRVARDGTAAVRSVPLPQPRMLPDLAHDRTKNVLLPATTGDAFLSALGITTGRGEVRPHMRGKYTQINEFLQLLEHTGELDRIGHRPVRLLDCGCGSAYLTFAAYHYLNDVRGIETEVTGIDVTPRLMEKVSAQRDALGYDRARFAVSSIAEYTPEASPDVVLSLHACDTATDEALALGVRHRARLVVAVPCCHNDLNRQLGAAGVFRPVVRHGILKQRMADLLTETFRAQLLRVLGYRTEVIEFVSTEHTAKNLMIRAVRAAEPGDADAIAEYRALRDYWGVTPCLEKLLGGEARAPLL
jgi:SAM-dependent methyltransferase